MQFISMYTFLYVYIHSKVVYLLTQKIRFVGSYGFVRWTRVVHAVSGSQCQDSRRLLRVAVSLCFGLQRELSIERLQMGKRHIAFMYDGRRKAGRGEEGDESYHDASLYCSVSSTSWSIMLQPENHCHQDKHTGMILVHKRSIGKRGAVFIACFCCSLPGRLLFPHHFVDGLTQWLGVF